MKRTALLTAILFYASTAMAQLPDGLYAVFDTTMGEMTCRLDYDKAPLTCANFIGLAEGSQNWVDPESSNVRNAPFFDDLKFHRVIDAFMIQTGCPLGTGSSGPGYNIPDEFDDALTHSGPGILSMANYGPDTGGSQFFITLDATTWLDDYHSIFGEVVEGMEVVEAIGAVPTDALDRPLVDVTIRGVTILRIGTEAENFDPSNQPLPEVEAYPLALTTASEVSGSAVDPLTNISLFESTNLTDWELSIDMYFTQETDGWAEPVSTEGSSIFFKAHQISYKDSVTDFLDIAGKTLTFTQGANILVFNPEGNGDSGTCEIVGNADTLDFWAEWTDSAYPGVVVFQPSLYSALRFILSTSGTCRGYQWDGFQWNDVGLFSFTLSN
ncbi:MAG: peptidylprolyl isomerase [Puniceicoccaceae bacterium]